MSAQSPGASPAQLTAESIAVAALRLIDDDGPGALSFRALGRVLGVSHMTVHRHCGDLAGLLDIAVDHLAEQIPAVDPEQPWAQTIEQLFGTLYRLIVAHPGLVVLRQGRPWLGPRILERLTEPALRANLDAGMTPQQAIATYRQCYLYTLGCASFIDHADPAAEATRTRTALAGLNPDAFPALTTHMRVVVDAVTDHEIYYAGLRRLIQAAHP